MIKTDRQPVCSTSNSVLVQEGLVTGGGAAASCTIAAGLRGVASITHSGSTGLYYVNYTDLPAGTLLSAMGAGNCSTPTAAKTKTAYFVKGSYDTSNKRFTLGVTDGSATPALADIATDEQISLRISWAETAEP